MDAEQFNQFIQDHNNILLVPSREGKFDTLPSALALAFILTDLGKNTTIYFPDPPPAPLHFLNLAQSLSSSIHKDNTLTIVIDTKISPLKNIQHVRAGDVIKIILKAEEGTLMTEDGIRLEGGVSDWDGVIAIGYGDKSSFRRELTRASLEITDEALFMMGVEETSKKNSSCSSEIITKILKEWNEDSITQRVATSLLAGLIASTNNFQKPGIKPQALFTAAYLISKKAEKEKIIRHLYKTKPLEFIKLWGYMLAKFTYDADKKIGYSTIEEKDFAMSGAGRSHVMMLVQELRNNFSQAHFFVLGIEKEDGHKVALLHAPQEERLARHAIHFNTKIKNSSLLTPLPDAQNINEATRLFVNQIKALM